VIHRDLKPENVLVHEGDRPAVKLADFGIARILASDERMTLTGALVGSPHHMAPEIVEGREADARSDLFSLGTILYWLATGKLPFAAPNPTAILRRVLEADFEDPRAADPRVPDALADLIVRCLSLEPEKRAASAAEVRDHLDRLLVESGLERPADELVAFLRDAAGFKAAFPPRATVALTARGDAALAERLRARVAFYSRVLAIDPGNAEIPAKLARLSRRRRLRRIAAWSGAAVALAALIAAGVSLAPRPPAPPPARAAAGPGTRAASAPAPEIPSPPPASATAGEAPVPAVERDGPPSAAPNPHGPPSAAPNPRGPRGDGPLRPREIPAGPPASLVVHVRPYAQRALLDGVEVARGEQLVRFSLPPGRAHVIQIDHACCAPFVREITAEEAQRLGELRVPLVPRPARLRVEGDPATRVYVDGKLVGTAGDSQRAAIAIPVPSGAESPYEAPARIGLETAGAAIRDMQVKLRAGGEVIVAAPQPGAARNPAPRRNRPRRRRAPRPPPPPPRSSDRDPPPHRARAHGAARAQAREGPLRVRRLRRRGRHAPPLPRDEPAAHRGAGDRRLPHPRDLRVPPRRPAPGARGLREPPVARPRLRARSVPRPAAHREFFDRVKRARAALAPLGSAAGRCAAGRLADDAKRRLLAESRRVPTADEGRARPERLYLFNWMPLGAGQFQNVDRAKGTAIAAGQVVAGLVNLGAILFHNQLAEDRTRTCIAGQPGCSRPPYSDSDRELLGRVDAVKYVSAGVFWALYAYGVWDAHKHFVPIVETEVAPGGGGGSVSLEWAF
jgi:serine/threonine-protein kinase